MTDSPIRNGHFASMVEDLRAQLRTASDMCDAYECRLQETEAEIKHLCRDYQTARDAHDRVLLENERLRAAMAIDKPRAAYARAVGQQYELLEDNERLRAALQTIADMTDYGTETATWRMASAIHNTNVIARTALDHTPQEGEK
jgi:hypothetical protein